MSKKYRVMLVSGGFDPVHKGHLQMIEAARELADEVWVILNYKGKLSMAFGNGGDRVQGNIPEEEYCNSMGVDMVWNLGKKVQSSSWLLEKYQNSAV